jgi:ABC-type multidrug transport system ATPase subunit
LWTLQGAGKTTLINMLTGLFAPDSSSGDSTVYGRSIRTDMSGARKYGLGGVLIVSQHARGQTVVLSRQLGVCPQHDVLFEHLTARETIVFFALMKGAPARAMPNHHCLACD